MASKANKMVLAKLRRKRTTIKATTTKLLNKINEILESEDTDKTDLELANEQLVVKESQIIDIDKEIEDKIEDLDELQREVETSDEYKDCIISVRFKIKKCLKGLEKSYERERNEERVLSETYVRPAEPVHKTRVKLPKLAIEKFSGNAESWLEFWSQFKTAIHENEGLSKIDKFNYLKGLLMGSASIAVQGLLISENNYDIAIDILQQRYGRKDIVIRSHVNKLMNLTPVRSTSNIKELRNLYDSCEIQIRSLESLGVELTSYGNLLFPMLIKLLPNNLVLDYNRSKPEDQAWNVKELLNFLKLEIENHERTLMFQKNFENQRTDYQSRKSFTDTRYSNRNSEREMGEKPKKERFHNIPAAYALNTSVQPKRPERSCTFCDESAAHSSDSCTKTVSERKIEIKRQGRCFLCLKRSHLAKFCLSRVRCQICNRRHNTWLCENDDKQSEEKSEHCNVNSNSEATLTAVSKNKTPKAGMFLQTVRANAESKNKQQNQRILLDGGSQRSFILERVSKQLNLKVVGEEEITIYSFGTDMPVKQKRKRVRLVLRDRRFKNRIEIEVLETEHISGALISAPGEDIKQYCLKANMQLADEPGNTYNSEITILIGSDYYWKVVTGRIHRISSSLVALDTIFGWSISGTSFLSDVTTVQSSIHVMKNATSTVDINSDREMNQLLQNFWNLEALGIEIEKDKSTTEGDILDGFTQLIRFKENRYEVRLPWNERADELGDNYEVALKRLNSLAQRFRRNPQLYERYKTVIEDYLEKGMAEESNQEPREKLYYMPHQAVIREDKDTTKLRVVFDASSHDNNATSLNQCLHSGPNLNPDLLGILIQFRQHRIAIIADIEKAFLQIMLSEDDRDAVRFLWIDGSIEEGTQFHIKSLRMTRVLFGATSSPFLLAATIKHHVDKFKLDYPKEFRILNNNLYVDDLVSGADEETEADGIRKNVKVILNKGSFHMRKWKTNVDTLRNTWNDLEEDVSKEPTDYCKVLGYTWNNKEDILKIDVSASINQLESKTGNITKRDILKTAAKLYDPIGFINPFTVKAKIMIQDIWKIGLKWDEILPLELQQRWINWCEELPKIEHLKFPRHYFGDGSRIQLKNVQLHCFTDASQKAYGAVIYLRYLESGEMKTSFVMSKSRVAPVKKMSLPRLELMAALIGARLSKYVQDKLLENLDILPFFWSDSSATLHWIKSDTKKWKPFVQNRVNEIQEKTEPCTWSYCPGKENPADLLTRGEKVEDLKESGIWWHGPNWLVDDETLWPDVKKLDFTVEDQSKELRKGWNRTTQTSCIVQPSNEDLFDISKHSSLQKIHRITAWSQRFIYNVKNANNKRLGAISEEELKTAEEYWIRRIQEQHFTDELKSLRNGKAISSDSKVKELNPFLDDKCVIRVGGRLRYSELNFSQSHPILLPNKSYLTDLHIKYDHEMIGHGGVAETLTQLRETFWIPKFRQRIKSVIRNCIVCRRFKLKPMVQEMAPLPPNRCREAHPFEITGIDYAGPLYTKDKNVRSKAYILLFTCAVTRAVHLELTPNMSAEEFLLAFKRFTARRGICKKLYSDNAKTFKKAKKEIDLLYESIREEKVQNYFSRQGIKWQFIVERAAWWGGFWERLVRSLKTCLKKILGKSSLSFGELETTVIEVEAILNSRPLTFVYSELGEPEPLTPGHFLIGRRLCSLPQGRARTESTKPQLLKRLNHQKVLVERIWRRWRTAYLMELRSAHHSKIPKHSTDIQKGTLVLIHEEKIPRLRWKMGIIEVVHPGRDGKTRACTVRLPNRTCVRRPVQLLYRLELDLEGQTSDRSPSGPEDVEV